MPQKVNLPAAAQADDQHVFLRMAEQIAREQVLEVIELQHLRRLEIDPRLKPLVARVAHEQHRPHITAAADADM